MPRAKYAAGKLDFAIELPIRADRISYLHLKSGRITLFATSNNIPVFILFSLVYDTLVGG